MQGTELLNSVRSPEERETKTAEIPRFSLRFGAIPIGFQTVCPSRGDISLVQVPRELELVKRHP